MMTKEEELPGTLEFIPVPTLVLAKIQEQQKQKQPAKYPFETLVVLLNSLIGADFLFSCNEYLKDTTAYRHKVKMLLKQLEPELMKIIDEDLDLLIGSNDNARVIFNLQDGFKNYIEQLQLNKFITHKPALLAGFGKLVEQFHQMPELVLHRNGIKIYDELEKTN